MSSFDFDKVALTIFSFVRERAGRPIVASPVLDLSVPRLDF